MAEIEIDDHQVDLIGGQQLRQLAAVLQPGHPEGVLGQIVYQEATQLGIVIDDNEMFHDPAFEERGRPTMRATRP
ncbi:hypothetical protein GCM10028812_03050 [Ancylobacter sonchi]